MTGDTDLTLVTGSGDARIGGDGDIISGLSVESSNIGISCS